MEKITKIKLGIIVVFSAIFDALGILAVPLVKHIKSSADHRIMDALPKEEERKDDEGKYLFFLNPKVE